MYYLRKALTMVAILCSVSLQAQAGTMSGKQLEALYATDVTECGYFPNEGTYEQYCEHFLKNGSILLWNTKEVVGKYRIDKKKGLVCLKYRKEQETCSAYKHKSGDIYNVQFGDGSRGDVTITKGIK